MLHLYLFSSTIFMLTAFLNLLTACLHPSSLSSHTLVNSGTLFLYLFLHLPMTQTLSKEEWQDTSSTNREDCLKIYKYKWVYSSTYIMYTFTFCSPFCWTTSVPMAVAILRCCDTTPDKASKPSSCSVRKWTRIFYRNSIMNTGNKH